MDTMLGMFGPALSEEGARFYLEQYGGRIELGRIFHCLPPACNLFAAWFLTKWLSLFCSSFKHSPAAKTTICLQLAIDSYLRDPTQHENVPPGAVGTVAVFNYCSLSCECDCTDYHQHKCLFCLFAESPFQMAAGCRVRRGRDWEAGCTDDGAPGLLGTVTEIKDIRGAVSVCTCTSLQCVEMLIANSYWVFYLRFSFFLSKHDCSMPRTGKVGSWPQRPSIPMGP